MIEIHSKSDCPYCHMAKAYLNQHAIAYTEYLYDDPEERQALYDTLRLQGLNRTVPQIFFKHNGITEYVGGYNALIKQDFKARLQVETFDAEF